MNDRKQRLLWRYVDKWAAEKPDAEAIIFGDTRMTWAQLAEAVDRCARALLEMGVQKGDCVALVAMARPEFIITFMAAAKISAIWLGVSPRFSIGEMGRILRDCRPAALITLDRYEKANLLERALTFSFEMSSIREILVLGEPSPGVLSFEEYALQARPHLDGVLAARVAEAREDDEALLMYTSGSSGLPKGVLHSHATILDNVCQQQRLFDINGDSRVLLHFPINHVAADVEIGYCAVYAGATLVMQEGFDAGNALDIIEKERISVLGQVPAMYLLEMRHPRFATMNWDSVRAFVWGGSSASQGMLDALAAICRRTGARMITGYGATELGGFVTATGGDTAIQEGGSAVGTVYDTCALRIVDERRLPLPAGEVGEIAVRGPVIMKGYLNSPGLTSEVLDHEGWYYSSDLGKLDGDGNLSICGRRSEMFKTGGENVFPCEIEAAIESHPAVLFAAVVAVPDEVFDEVAHAHVMVVSGKQAGPEELMEWCRERLAPYKVPRVISIHAALPLLPNGKVDKLKLRESMSA